MSISAEEVANHPFTTKVAQKYASRMIRRGHFRESDRDAIAQELIAKVIECWDKFDAAAGHHKSFVCTVISHCSANLVRNQRTKRRGKRPVSLSAIVNVPCEGTAELAQTIGEEELDRRLTRKSRLSESDLIALAHDLEQVIATLTPEQQQLVELRKSMSMTQIAAELNIPRSTLKSRWAILGERFRKAGLQEYLCR